MDYTERCLRQFGLNQQKIGRPDSHDLLHSKNAKGRIGIDGRTNWALYHRDLIRQWCSRENISGTTPFSVADWQAYIEWYLPRTIPILSPIIIPEDRIASDYQSHARQMQFFVS